MKKRRNRSPRFVVCLRNDGYPEALELRKLYRVLPDAQAAKVGHVRVIDESGEDYLYPKSFFAAVRVSEPIKRALVMSSSAA
jgi:hypothetical protein